MAGPDPINNQVLFLVAHDEALVLLPAVAASELAVRTWLQRVGKRPLGSDPRLVLIQNGAQLVLAIADEDLGARQTQEQPGVGHDVHPPLPDPLPDGLWHEDRLPASRGEENTGLPAAAEGQDLRGHDVAR